LENLNERLEILEKKLLPSRATDIKSEIHMNKTIDLYDEY